MSNKYLRLLSWFGVVLLTLSGLWFTLAIIGGAHDAWFITCIIFGGAYLLYKYGAKKPDQAAIKK